MTKKDSCSEGRGSRRQRRDQKKKRRRSTCKFYKRDYRFYAKYEGKWIQLLTDIGPIMIGEDGREIKLAPYWYASDIRTEKYISALEKEAKLYNKLHIDIKNIARKEFGLKELRNYGNRKS